MKKIYLFIVGVVLWTNAGYGQCESVTVTLHTQWDVDHYAANYGCTTVGNLFIGSPLGLGNSDITNLDALSPITVVQGYLMIIDAPYLSDITGLNNLITVGDNLSISSVSAVALTGFANLTSVGGAFGINNNTNLTSLNGFGNLLSIGTICEIAGNPALTQTPVFSDLTSVGSDLRIETNNSLVSVSMPSLTHCGGAFHLSDNPNLTDISGLNALTTVSHYFMIRGTSASSLSGFPSLTTIGGSFLLNEGTSALQSLTGFQNLASIGGGLYIKDNAVLTQLPNFISLISVGDLSVLSNNALTDLSGLENLRGFNGTVAASHNPSLTSIAALSNVETINGALEITDNALLTTLTGIENISPSTITNLNISDNPLLTTCNAASICTYIASGGPYNITGNAPGCANVTQVQVACGVPQDCGYIQLFSQAEIDNYPVNYGCTQINLALVISGSDITNLDGLSQITYVQDLDISNVPLLTDWSGLNNLGLISGSFSLSGNTASTITGFTGLDSVYYFVLHDTNNLTALNGFSSLETITGTCFMYSNAQLVSSPSFPSLTSVGAMSITNNPALQDLSGFSALASVTSGGIDLNGNGVLASVSGLSAMTSLIGPLHIQNHPALLSLSGIENINPAGITYLLINGNSLLATCNQSSVCSYIATPGTAYYIENNAPGCANPTQVQIACGAPPECWNVTLSSQADVDNYPVYYGCSAIGGLLSISGADITNLDGLSQVTSVGQLDINQVPLLADFSGLDGLTTITGHFNFYGDTTANVTAFPNVTAVGGNFSINNTLSLESFAAFPSLISIGGDLNIASNTLLIHVPAFSSLNAVGGALSIHTNPLITNLDGLSSLTAVERYITVSYNSALTSLSGLGNINMASVDSLNMDSNPFLVTCNLPNICTYLANGGGNYITGNAPSCNSTTQIHIACGNPQNCNNVVLYTQADIDNFPFNYGCSQITGYLQILGGDITNLDGLSQITSVETLMIYDVPNLTDFSGMDNLTTITGDFTIYGSTATTITAFPNVTTLSGSLNLIYGTSNLQSLTIFPSLTTIGGHYNFASNSVMTQLPIVSSLATVNTVSINYNPLLVNVNALSTLTTATGVSVTYNEQLTSLTGLDNINAGDISLYSVLGNPLLTTCNVASLCTYLFNGGYAANIYSNAPDSGCGSSASVMAACNPNCPAGDVHLTTQAEVDAFAVDYPNCTQLNGNLHIEGADINNLNALSGITSVYGSLQLYNNEQLESLSGLHQITNVFGNVEIINNDLLVNFNGLNLLTTVSNAMTVSGNDALADMSGMTSLTRVNNWFTVENNAVLSKFSTPAIHDVGNLGISSNPQLENLEGLDNLITVGTIDINNNAALTDLSALDGVTYIATLGISGNEVLTAIAPLTNITNIGNIYIGGNPALTSIDGFPNLTVLQNLAVNSNGALTSLSGLEGVTSLSTLNIDSNAALTSLSGLDNVTYINNVYIANNASLSNLTGLNSLQDAVTFQIAGNESLTSLNGLNSLINSYGQMNIVNNASLVSLSGLDAFSNTYQLYIYNNLVLASLSALSNLTSVYQLNVSYNPELVSLSGLDNLEPGTLENVILESSANLATCNVPSICTYLSNGGQSTISGNATSCNSSLEVQIACNTGDVCPSGNLVFSTQAQVDAFIVNYPDCSVIDGIVTISGPDITNLNGLSNITGVNQGLTIESNYVLTDLTGLNLLSSVGGTLTIRSNTLLTSLAGLEYLVSVNRLTIDQNNSLVSLAGLQTLLEVHEAITISNNPSLVSLNGLQNVTTMGSLDIASNEALTSLTTFSCTNTGDMSFYNNQALTNLNGLDSFTSMNSIYIVLNNSLVSLQGLHNLTTLNNMNYPWYYGYGIHIADNALLQSLAGLESINPATINSITLYNSPQLSYCSLSNICSFFALNLGSSNISSNHTGCSSAGEIQVGCGDNVRLKLFIEGYYDPNTGTMVSVKYNQDGVSPVTDVATVTVELHAVSPPFDVIASTTAMLKTDGTLLCTFDSSHDELYYLSVSGSNFIKTYTATPVTVGATYLEYAFINDRTKALGSNMADLGNNVYAFYSGDMDQNGFVDGTDYSLWEGDYNNFAYGEYVTDMNGDAFVDGTDYSIWEGSYNQFIYSVVPE